MLMHVARISHAAVQQWWLVTAVICIYTMRTKRNFMLMHVARISHAALQQWWLVTAVICSFQNPIRSVKATVHLPQNVVYRQVTNSDYLNVLQTIVMGKAENLCDQCRCLIMSVHF